MFSLVSYIGMSVGPCTSAKESMRTAGRSRWRLISEI